MKLDVSVANKPLNSYQAGGGGYGFLIYQAVILSLLTFREISKRVYINLESIWVLKVQGGSLSLGKVGQ